MSDSVNVIWCYFVLHCVYACTCKVIGESGTVLGQVWGKWDSQSIYPRNSVIWYSKVYNHRWKWETSLGKVGQLINLRDK